MLENVSQGNSSFARALGSSEFHTRERGLQALTLWLSRRPDVTDKDLLKLWKGVFYCFWHSDSAPVQVGVHAVPRRRHNARMQRPGLKKRSCQYADSSGGAPQRNFDAGPTRGGSAARKAW